jgi:hypothetical protein
VVCREENMDIKVKIKEVLANLLKVKIEELKDDATLIDSIGSNSEIRRIYRTRKTYSRKTATIRAHSFARKS